MCVTLLLLGLTMMPSRADAQVSFTDVADDTGIAGLPGAIGDGIGGGVAWLDYDGDGDLDLAFSAATIPPKLYENQDGILVESVFALIADTPPAEGGGLVALDADGDGDQDLILLRQADNVFFRNDGGVFVDASTEHLPGIGQWSASAAAGDFDGDGDDDLLIANYIAGVSFPDHQCARSTLLENDGTGRFIDVTAEYGVLGDGCSLGAAMSDYDRDGDIDLLIINDFGHFSIANQLYRNDGPSADGGWTFTDVSEESGFAYAVYGMGVGIGDTDDDGWQEYYSTSIGRQVLQSAGPGGIFTDRTAELSAGVPLELEGYQMTWSALFEDFDGDGWLDLFATAGHIPAASFIKNGQDIRNLLFAGGPSGFTVDPEGWWMPDPMPNSARGLSMGDFNGDGQAEMAVGHVHGVLSIYQVPDSVAPPLRIRPTPTTTGTSAAGFVVRSTCGDITRTRELSTGGHLGSSSPSEVRLTFPGECGLPGTALELNVRWPSGYVQTASTTMGSLLELTEPQWITLSDSGLSFTPTDATGQPITDPSLVSVTATNATVGPVTLVDGAFSVNYSPTGEGPVRFDITVDGQLLPVHPTRRWTSLQPRTLRTFPQQVRVGADYEIHAVLRGPDGAPLPASAAVSIQVGETVHTPTDNGDGSYTLAMPAPAEAGEQVVQILDNGAPFGAPLGVQILAAPSPELSRLRMGPLLATVFDLSGGAPFRAYLVARDVNGYSLDTGELTYELIVNGVPLPPSDTTSNGGQVLLSYPMSAIPDGATLQFFVDGVEFPGPQTFSVIPEGSTAIDSVDLTASRCAFVMSAMQADGVDIATAVVFPRDSYGNPIRPEVLPLEFEGNQGLSVLAESIISQDDRWTFSVRAGTQTGFATVHVTSNGVPTGLQCTIEALEPVPAGDGSTATSGLEVVPNKLPAGSSSTAKVLGYPRTAVGRLVGPKAGIALTTSAGDLEDAGYVGIGVYQGVFTAPDEPGIATITLADGDKILATVNVEIFDPSPPIDTGPDEDAVSSDIEELDTWSPTPDAGPDLEVIESDVSEPDVAESDTIAPDSVEADAGSGDTTGNSGDDATIGEDGDGLDTIDAGDGADDLDASDGADDLDASDGADDLDASDGADDLDASDGQNDASDGTDTGDADATDSGSDATDGGDGDTSASSGGDVQASSDIQASSDLGVRADTSTDGVDSTDTGQVAGEPGSGGCQTGRSHGNAWPIWLGLAVALAFCNARRREEQNL